MRKLFLLAALGLAACAQPGAPLTCTAPLKPALELGLYFGLDIEGGGVVSEAQWAQFVADEVTPRFPDGLSVLNVAGQSRTATNQTLRERTKLMVVVVFDVPSHRAKADAIIAAYGKRFGQNNVFRTEHSVCAGA